MKPDHPLAKLRQAFETAMAEVKKVPSGPSGHVGPVLSGRNHRTDEAELAKFEEIVCWLAEMRFGQSDCDMPWVEVHLVDRTRNEGLAFTPIPYSHKAETEDDHWRIVELAQMNLTIASSRLDTAMKIYQDVRQRTKERAKS